jgi:hypothetical protein
MTNAEREQQAERVQSDEYTPPHPCCFCGYNGYDDDECLLDPISTGTHCKCWWDSGEPNKGGRIMKGNNEILLNAATMIEAVQLWADANFKEPVTVLAVDQASKTSYEQTFKVQLSVPEKAPS